MSPEATPCNIGSEDLLTAMTELPQATAVSWPSLTVTFSSSVSSNGIISLAFELNSFVVGRLRRWYWAPVGATAVPGPPRERPTLRFVAQRDSISLTQPQTGWIERGSID